jgi:hypothetical protein
MSKKVLFLTKNDKKRHFWPILAGGLLEGVWGSEGVGPGNPKMGSTPPKRGGIGGVPKTRSYMSTSVAKIRCGGPIYLVTSGKSGGVPDPGPDPDFGFLGFLAKIAIFCHFFAFFYVFYSKVKKCKKRVLFASLITSRPPKQIFFYLHPPVSHVCHQFCLFFTLFWTLF